MRGSISYIQHKIGERNYILLCDPTSPLSEIREAILNINIEIDEIEKIAIQAQADAEQQVQVEEPVQESQ